MSAERVERRLAAILAADVVGYSRLMGEDEAGTLARLRSHRRELIAPKVAEHKGRIVKTTGDGILIEFPSVVEAVACALAVQQGMAKRNAETPEHQRIVFRVGINLGDVIVEDEDIHGDGVNVAARLEGIAEPGGICVSGVVHEQVQGRLDCTFDVLGEQVLKNIARPVPVYRVAAGPPASGRQPGETPAVRSEPLPLPDKPSIAVLPFQNMSGDPEQNYFADGIVEEIITALSRMRWLFVIARNSSFTYKGQAVDVKRVGRELGVRYVLEGSVRRAGDRLRITAQLVEAETGVHLWADRFDGSMEDVFEFQEEATRRVVAAVAPGIESAEIAFARRSAASSDALSAAWRAMGLFNDAIQQGNKAAMLAAIDEAQKALSLDQGSLSALSTLGFAYRMSHLYRWGDDPNQALDQAWAVSERMMAVDALDERTLIDCGLTRVARGEHERGIADLQRAFQINPNSAIALRALAYVEARLGMSAKAKEHALAFLRLCPRDNIWIGPAQLALAMACYTAGEYAEAVHWAELAIQSQPRAPIRRSIMIACAARAGDLAKAARERTMLNSFAPDFIPSLFRGENPVFTRPEDLEHLLEGLRLAMGPAA